MKSTVQNPRSASMLDKTNDKVNVKNSLRSSNPIRFVEWVDTMLGPVKIYDNHTNEAIINAYTCECIITDKELEALACFEGFYANAKTGHHPAKLSDACVEDYIFHLIKEENCDLIFYAEYRY